MTEKLHFKHKQINNLRLAVLCTRTSARIGTVWDGMPHRHFLAFLKPTAVFGRRKGNGRVWRGHVVKSIPQLLLHPVRALDSDKRYSDKNYRPTGWRWKKITSQHSASLAKKRLTSSAVVTQFSSCCRIRQYYLPQSHRCSLWLSSLFVCHYALFFHLSATRLCLCASMFLVWSVDIEDQQELTDLEPCRRSSAMRLVTQHH